MNKKVLRIFNFPFKLESNYYYRQLQPMCICLFYHIS